MKFGGTSMGSADRIRVAANLILEQHARSPGSSRRLRYVESDRPAARSHETRRSARFRRSRSECVGKVRAKHLEAVAGLSLPPKTTRAVEELIADFERIVGGMLMLGERPARSVDEAVIIGERLSALLLASFLGDGAVAINSATLIVTDGVFGNASPFLDKTAVKAQASAHPTASKPAKFPSPPVSTEQPSMAASPHSAAAVQTFSASILSAALNAEELWIWTDVDGIMTADPRLVPDARVLEELSFSEAAELAYNGAKVLHPRTLSPLIEQAHPRVE